MFISELYRESPNRVPGLLVFIVVFLAAIISAGFLQQPRLREKHYTFVFDKKKSTYNFTTFLIQNNIDYLSEDNSLVLWNSIPDQVNLNPEGIISAYGSEDPRVDSYIKKHHLFFNDDASQYIYLSGKHSFLEILLLLLKSDLRMTLFDWADVPLGVNSLNLFSLLVFQIVSLLFTSKKRNLWFLTMEAIITAAVFYWGFIPWALFLVIELFRPSSRVFSETESSGVYGEEHAENFEHPLFQPVPIVGSVDIKKNKKITSRPGRFRLFFRLASLVFLFLFPVLGDQFMNFERRIPLYETSPIPVSAKSLYNDFHHNIDSIYPGIDDYIAHIIFQRYFMYKQDYNLPQPDSYVSLNRYYEVDNRLELNPELLFIFDSSFISSILETMDNRDAISLILGEKGYYILNSGKYQHSWYFPLTRISDYLLLGFLVMLIIRILLFRMEKRAGSKYIGKKVLRRRRKAA